MALVVWYLLSILIHFQNYNEMVLLFYNKNTFCYNNFCTKTDTSDRIKYYTLPSNAETQQENTNENNS